MFQPGGATSVIDRAFNVLPAIHLYDQARFKTDEVDYVATKGELAPESISFHLALTNALPEDPLGIGHVLAKVAGSLGGHTPPS